MKSKGCAPAADPVLVLGGSSLVLLISGTPKSRNAEPTTQENQNHHNSNRQKSKTPTCRTPSTTRDNNKDQNDDIWESKRHPKRPRKGGQRAPPNLALFGLLWKLFLEPFGAHFGPLGAQSRLLGLLGAPFGAPGGHFWACPAEAENGPKRQRKTCQKC
jgi:hypothetical protein